MSATLAGSDLAARLGNCPVLRFEGRQLEWSIAHKPHSADPLECWWPAQWRPNCRRGKGDILVFLPGASEIHRSMRACQGLAQRKGAMIVPLHGELSPKDRTSP